MKNSDALSSSEAADEFVLMQALLFFSGLWVLSKQIQLQPRGETKAWLLFMKP